MATLQDEKSGLPTYDACLLRCFSRYGNQERKCFHDEIRRANFQETILVSMMHLALAHDYRSFGSRDAVQFPAAVKRALEPPRTLPRGATA